MLLTLCPPDALFALGLAHEKVYLDHRDNKHCGEAVKGFSEAIEAYKKCARQNKKDMRARCG